MFFLQDQVGNVKMQYHKPKLVENLPSQFLTFMNHLMTLQFEDRPDYELIKKLFTEMLHEAGGTEESPFDWETDDSKHQILRSAPSLYSLCLRTVLQNITKYQSKLKKLPRELRSKILKILFRLNAPDWPEKEQIEGLIDSDISELDLEDNKIDEKQSNFVMSKCKNLTSIKLSSASDSNLPNFLMPNVDSIENLHLSSCTQLSSKVVKYFEQCTQLRSVTIRNADKLNDKHLDVLIRNCPYLKELNIIDCRRVKGSLFKPLVAKKAPVTALNSINLSLCPLSKKSIRAMAKFASNLQSITLNPLVTNYSNSTNDILNLIHESKNLTHLSLVTFRLDLDQILCDISKFCTKLTSIHIDGNGITDLGLQNLIQNCKNIKHIEFRYSENVSESTIQRLQRQLPDIKTIKIHFMSKFFHSSLSEHSISSLIKSSNHLESLTLDKCLLLSRSCFGDSLRLSCLRELNISDCINLADDDLLVIILSCINLVILKMNNMNQLNSDSLLIVSSAAKLEELYILHCVNFTDEIIISLINIMPNLFIHLTRYPTIDLTPKKLQLHSANAERVLDKNPNSFSHKIMERFRRSISNSNPNNVF